MGVRGEELSGCADRVQVVEVHVPVEKEKIVQVSQRPYTESRHGLERRLDPRYPTVVRHFACSPRRHCRCRRAVVEAACVSCVSPLPKVEVAPKSLLNAKEALENLNLALISNRDQLGEQLQVRRPFTGLSLGLSSDILFVFS
jgi:hypothetical protein